MRLPRLPHDVPRRRAFPLLGALLALGSPLGWLVLRSILAGRTPSPAFLAAELSADPAAIAYLTLSTLTVFVVLGFVLGAREDRLAETSITDPLTRLHNRRHIDARLDEEIARGGRQGGSVAVLLLDVDHLKQINDRHGHEGGDAALRAVAEALRRTCRATDLPARYGGDEFVVLLPGSTAADGLTLAGRIRATLREAPGAPTVSIGVADVDHAAAPRPEALLEAADAALYRAKASGRDCAVVAGDAREGR